MRIEVYLPLLTSIVLGLAAPRLSRWLPPATATRALVAAAPLSAVSTAYVLALLAWTLVVQIPMVAGLGRWSVHVWDSADPVPYPVALAAALALAFTALRVARTVIGHHRAMTEVRHIAEELDGEPGGLVVVDDVSPKAFAIPSKQGGRVVVSTGMLNALTPAEQRVLLAHERTHLTHRHHLYRALADAAACANPFLTRLPRAVRYASERWADEEAATAVGDRALAARALARAALASVPRTAPAAAAMGYHLADVPARVQALLRPRQSHRPVVIALLVGLIALTLWASFNAGHDTESLLELAGSPTAASCASHCRA
ncbi:M56 family metallopeptidase [Streptosporangium subroseum]|uniref:M56 family metallopeptidase n=1 Tax=Streptosporangium subroseum TaxID=106412 RepID=UPI00341A6234